MAGLTALQALHAAKVEQGQKVLVTGASGGVGSFTVQIAKAMGAEVTAVCSTRNVDRVRSIGADHVIDYTQEDFTENGPTYDVIVDNAGARSLRNTGRAMSPKGTLIPNNGQLDRPWVASLPRLFRTMAWSWFGRQKAHGVLYRKPGGSRVPQGDDRSRASQTPGRSHLPNRRGTRGHGLSRRGACTRQDRGRHLIVPDVDTMKAVVQTRYGPPDEVLELREVAIPQIGDDEVLVRVRAASVHPDVWHVVMGRPYALRIMGAGLTGPKNPVPGNRCRRASKQ